MNSPFISICIPAYNRTRLLKKLLDSIRIQNFTGYEVLINDDSRGNEVAELLLQYADLPVSYVKNETAAGAVANCIKVMRRARAPWIKVMHDDDWFATADALQQFAEAASECGKDFIFCASNQVQLNTGETEKEELVDERKKMLDDSLFSLFYLNVIGHPSVVLHKNDPTIEYDPEFNWVLDIDFYMRYLQQHGTYHYIESALVNIGNGDAQESAKYYKNFKVEIPEYFTLLCKYNSSLLLQNRYVFHLVWNMLKRFKIKSIDDIRATGYTGTLPDKVEDIIRYQKKIPAIILKQPPWSKKLMLRCFKRLA